MEKLTELLLELLLGQSFINPNVEALFKTCALKLMLRWPSIADKFVPMLEGVLDKEEKLENPAINKRKLTAMELLAEIQPLIFFQKEPESLLSLKNIFNSAQQGTALWQQIAVSFILFFIIVRKKNVLQNLFNHVNLYFFYLSLLFVL